eukprot:scaffold403_cov127-Isochrysis_galbana.AAC.1
MVDGGGCSMRVPGTLWRCAGLCAETPAPFDPDLHTRFDAGQPLFSPFTLAGCSRAVATTRPETWSPARSGLHLSCQTRPSTSAVGPGHRAALRRARAPAAPAGGSWCEGEASPSRRRPSSTPPGRGG